MNQKMIKFKFTYLSFTFALFFLLTESAVSLSNKEVADIADGVIVQIEGADSEASSPDRQGTGVLIDRTETADIILTNWHVVKQAGNYNIFPARCKFRNCLQAFRTIDHSNIKYLPGTDLAIIRMGRTINPVQKAAMIGDSELINPGSEIYIGGWPSPIRSDKDGYRRSQFFSGQVSAIDQNPENEYLFKLSSNIPSLGGLSGSPIFDTNAKLVGIYGCGVRTNTGDETSVIARAIPINFYLEMMPSAERAKPQKYRATDNACTNIQDSPLQPKQIKMRDVERFDFNADGSQLAMIERFSGIRIYNLKNDQIQEIPLVKDHINSTGFGQIIFTGDKRNLVSIDGNLLTNWDLISGKYVAIAKYLDIPSYILALTTPQGSSGIVTGGNDSIHIIDSTTGVINMVLKGHTGAINSVEVSPDKKFIYSASEDSSVRIWDFRTGKEIRKIDTNVIAMALSPDGKFIVSSSADRKIRVWDSSTGEIVREMNGHYSKVNSVSFHPKLAILATASELGVIKIWNYNSGKLLHSIHAHPGKIEQLKFSPDGNTFASLGQDRQIKLWKFNELKIPTSSLEPIRKDNISVPTSRNSLINEGDFKFSSKDREWLLEGLFRGKYKVTSDHLEINISGLNIIYTGKDIRTLDQIGVSIQHGNTPSKNPPREQIVKISKKLAPGNSVNFNVNVKIPIDSSVKLSEYYLRVELVDNKGGYSYAFSDDDLFRNIVQRAIKPGIPIRKATRKPALAILIAFLSFSFDSSSLMVTSLTSSLTFFTSSFTSLISSRTLLTSFCKDCDWLSFFNKDMSLDNTDYASGGDKFEKNNR